MGLWSKKEGKKITLLPETRLGKWSVGFAVAFILLFALVLLLTLVFGVKGDSRITFDPLSIIFMATMILALLSGVLAFFTGIISIIKSKERSVLVFLTTIMGLFILILVLGELLSAIGVLPSH